MPKRKKPARRSKTDTYTLSDLCDFEERRDRGGLTPEDADLEALYEKEREAVEPVLENLTEWVEAFSKHAEGRETIHRLYGRDDIDFLSLGGIARLQPILWQFCGLTKEEFLRLTPGEVWDILKLWLEREKANEAATVKWSKPDYPSQWAHVFGVNRNKMAKLLKQGKIRNKKISDRKYRIAVDDLPPDYRE